MMARFRVLLISLLLSVSIVVAGGLTGTPAQSVAAANTINVPGDYSTIQAAIDAATEGDTIVVAAGTYSGTANGEVFPIVVNKQVTLLGAQANVDPRPGLGGRSGAETVIDGEETSETVIQVAASGVVINGFTITGGSGDMVREYGFDSDNKLQGLLFCYNVLYDYVEPGDEGIQIAYSDNVIIEYNYAHDLFQDAFSICRSSNGVIQYNEAHNIASENAAIYCYLTTNTDIIGNLVYSVDRGDDEHGNGIQLGDYDDGVMSTGGIIRDNVIHDVAQDGICIERMTGVTVEGNTIYGADSHDGAIFLRSVQSSTFNGNTVYNNDAIGVLVKSSSGLTFGGNNIHDNADTNDTRYPGTAGIWIVEDSDASTIGIHCNNIYGNAEYGLKNLDTLHTVSATRNWWGAASGPAHSSNPGGTGDAVSDYVSYSPWRTVASGSPMTWNVSPGGSIQAAVDAACPGDIVAVAAGTYVGKVTINKSLTLRGANYGISAGAIPGTRGPESIIQGGVQIGGNGVVIDGFKIDGPATSGEKDGIYIVGGTSGHTIVNNVLTGLGTSSADDGWAMVFGHLTSDIVVRNNGISNWWSTYVNPTGPSANILFEGNHFHDNHVGIGSDGLDDVNIQYNRFTNNILEGFGTSAIGSNVRAHYNDFVGNGAGINNYDDAGIVDATNNWWGDGSGPSGVGPGTGDAVSAYVDYDPWLGSSFFAPTVTAVNPTSGEQGQSLSVTVTGTNFASATDVGFGDNITTTGFTINSDTQISASITIDAEAEVGTRDVWVTSPYGTGTLVDGFTVVAPPPGPPAAPALISPENGAEVPGGSVTYQWNAVSGAVNYRLVVSRGTNIMNHLLKKITVDVGTATSYVDTGYAAVGYKYYWWVFAYNAEGTQSLWADVSANGRWFINTPSMEAPTLVSPEQGAEVAGGSVTFQWNSVPGAVEYRLVVSRGSNILNNVLKKTVVDLTTTSYVDTGYPEAGYTYYWWVFAWDAEGAQSPWPLVSANGRWFINSYAVRIEAPTLVSPENGANVPGTSVTFQWNPVSGAVNYRLVVSRSSDILNQALKKTVVDVGTATSYVDTGYSALGYKYYWWVFAFDVDSAQSPWAHVSANGRWFIDAPDIAAPTLVSPANGVAVSGTSVTFQWNAVAGAVNYRLVVSTSSDFSNQTAKKTIVDVDTATSYLDTGYPADGTVYYWWVFAYDANGKVSLWSQVSANGRWFTSVA